MKKNRRSGYWIGGILLILASIGGCEQGDFGSATFCLVAGIIILPPVRERIFRQRDNQSESDNAEILYRASSATKQNPQISFDDVFTISSESTNVNETTISLDIVDQNKLLEYLQQHERAKQQKIKNFKYIPQQVIGSVIQALESLYIMDSTKKLDTLKGRSEFAEEKLDFLKLASYNKRYITDVQAGLDQYKAMYYDKLPTEEQIAALLKPEEFDYAEFHCRCILKSFQRFYDEQNDQIIALKRPDAIRKRREKIMDTIREVQMDIPTMASSFSQTHEKLEALYDQVYKETY